jgi:hypothetical protein
MQIGLGLSITSQLRFGTALYAVNSFDPDFVLDFKNSYYRTGGSNTSLSGSVTHARAGHATMVDSDGLIKWAPHNLLIRSEELNLWSQTGAGSIVVDNAVAPDGTTTAATFTIGHANFHRYINSSGAYTAGDIITFSFWARSDNITSIGFGINGGANGANNYIYDNVAVTSTWNLIEFEFTVAGTDGSLYYIIGKQATNPVANQIGDVEIWHPHAYRSDLGGMVNNSETGNSYAPTTSSAVYLPRVGHHIYNGSAWVNEGVLHESEARTNLVTYSNDFTDASWTRNVTVTPNDAVSPDGTSNASHLSFPSTGYFYISSNSRTVGQQYTVSAWVKSYDGTDEAFQLYGENGYLSQNFIATSEWQRFSFTYTATTSTGSVGGIARPTTNIPASLHVYGIQMEAGSTPSSYIPTSGSTVTRAADILTVPAANLPYSSANMSIQMDGKITYADDGSSDRFVQWGNQGDDEIRLNLEYGGAQTGSPNFIQRAGGVIDILSDVNAYSPNINLPFNIASRHGSSFMNGAVDGTALTADTTPTALPNLSSSTLSLGYDFMGTIAQFRVWDEDLTDTGIEEAST